MVVGTFGIGRPIIVCWVCGTTAVAVVTSPYGIAVVCCWMIVAVLCLVTLVLLLFFIVVILDLAAVFTYVSVVCVCVRYGVESIICCCC